MLLTITNTAVPATDLGYLLHKNPSRVHSASLSHGQAHVFYPVATSECCTAALMIDIDPIGLVRGRRGNSDGGALDQYVNDRPYVASSFLSVALADLFGTALSGRCKERPELVDVPLPLRAEIAVLPCRGGEPVLRRLFEPLGYRVSAQCYALDEKFPAWGMSRLYTVTLEATVRLRDLLSHLYVLVPALDDAKHYWVGDDEVTKLLRRGGDWLAAHPEKELIVTRYLKHRRSLAKVAMAQLMEENQPDPDEAGEARAAEEDAIERPLSLNEQRLGTVLAVLKKSGAHRVLDLGCGEGRLLARLLDDAQYEKIVGLDVSHRALEIAVERLHLDRLPPMKRQRIELLHGSLMYRDKRLTGFEATTVIEVIEHLDAPRLAAFERVLFECAQPPLIVLTTPNREYNARFAALPAGQFRHRDHRFEWTRAEFESWAGNVAGRFRYRVEFLPVGPLDTELGAPTQMGVFRR